MMRLTLLAVLFVSFLGLVDACSANLIIVNTPSGTTVCTPLGDTGTVICN
jgi:hypothetical protein